MIRHMFAGGNTPNGFFSYFNHILPIEKSKRTIYMKGGSGTGKSTFMKKIGAHFEEEGYDMEYFHCSNDIDSLDGVCMPKLKIAIIDATAPHAQDPVIPMAADEIMNVAECLNSEGLRPHVKELSIILAEKKELIKAAYGYLNAAYTINKNSISIYERFLYMPALNNLTYDIMNKTFEGKRPSDTEGKHRRLFASAITPEGFVHYLDALFHCDNTTILTETEGYGGSKLLFKVNEEALLRGFDTEGYYSPLSPESLEHLIIPELNCCFVTNNRYHQYQHEGAHEIDLYNLCGRCMKYKYNEKLIYNQEMFDELSKKAMDSLKESSELHKRIEEIYIANMDFDKLNKMYDKLIEELSCFR